MSTPKKDKEPEYEFPSLNIDDKSIFNITKYDNTSLQENEVVVAAKLIVQFFAEREQFRMIAEKSADLSKLLVNDIETLKAEINRIREEGSSD